jgi:hypothetical protein
MKDKLQLIYDEFIKYEPDASIIKERIHKWHLARNHLRRMLIDAGGEDKIMKQKREIRELGTPIPKRHGLHK